MSSNIYTLDENKEVALFVLTNLTKTRSRISLPELSSEDLIKAKRG